MPLQVAVPLVGTGHAVHDVAPVPHVAVDVLLSHVPLQECVPPGQPQPPPRHTLPFLQAFPHVPQLLLSFERLTQALEHVSG